MSQPFLGEIRIFSGNFAPLGWALCNGQLLSITQNTALFALIGTYYGGDGVSNFALPNLQGSIPLGMGAGPGLSSYNLGQTGGSATLTLTTGNLPDHTHAVAVDNGSPTSPTHAPGATTYLAPTLRNEAPIYSAGTPNVAMGAQSVGSTGAGASFSSLQPSLVLTFIIALEGIFPSRS